MEPLEIVTRFTLEEMRHLQALPTEYGHTRPYPERREIASRAWMPMGFMEHESPFAQVLWSSCFARNCDLSVHVWNGWVYYRHGEALARIPDSGEPGIGMAGELVFDWLTMIHAREEAMAMPV